MAPSDSGPAAPVIPVYGTGTLSAVLPGAAAALGVRTGLTELPLPSADRVCVVLVDGLGELLLREAVDAGFAPFLGSLLAAEQPTGGSTVLRAGCPTTTATSMGSFGTGLTPGRHGLVGYEVRDPDRGVLLNELRWDPYTDPVSWQPYPTVFSKVAAAGVAVTNVGAAEFRGSGLTEAVHRGAEFVGVKDLHSRVDVALTALQRPGRQLVYLYWGAVDTAGHEKGWRSAEWRAELMRTDQQLARLAESLPAGTVLVVTADHGMVDVPHHSRLDIAKNPALRQGIGILGGEPRMVQIYCRHRTDEVVSAVAARFADAVGDRAWVRTRAEAVSDGWFGAVDRRVSARIGDVLVAARGDFAVIDSEVMHKKSLALIGHHGSLTEAEQLIPLLVHRS